MSAKKTRLQPMPVLSLGIKLFKENNEEEMTNIIVKMNGIVAIGFCISISFSDEIFEKKNPAITPFIAKIAVALVSEKRINSLVDS